MGTLFSALTVYGLYTMSSVPFMVWAGQSAYAGTVAREADRPWPGISRTIFRVVLPLLLIFLYAWNASTGEQASFQFLLLPPALGSIAGYGIGFFMGKRTKR
jgi:predicted permease